MADKLRVAFFLEDSAQESFIPPLFLRLADEGGFGLHQFDIRILCSRGGGSLEAYTKFLLEAARFPHLTADLLVVGSDANCKGFVERRNQIQKSSDHSVYPAILTAIPDPHIERWFLLDLPALSRVAKTKLAGAPPAYKCDKNRYKTVLREVFRGSDVTPLLGGVEYGPELARTMDLYTAAKLDHGLADFIDLCKAWLKQQSKQP
jgi:hypothetical protein